MEYQTTIYEINNICGRMGHCLFLEWGKFTCASPLQDFFNAQD